jgi:HlyD family secretion protein
MGGRAGRWFTLGLVAVFVGGVTGAWWWQQTKPTADAARSGLPPTPLAGVGALGRLEPGWKVYQIAPAESGRVEQLRVEEGMWVDAGAVLATLHTHAPRQAAYLEAQAQVQVAQARLALVKAGTKPEERAAQEALVAKHRATLELARTVLQRADQMVANRTISSEEHDQRRFDVAVQQATLQQAEKTLAAMRAIRAEDVAVAAAELAKATAGVARAEADLQMAQVLAPHAGRVLKIHARAGERVGDAGLCELGDTATMHAVAEVYERDAPRIRIGQRAKIIVQSLPGELTGQVLQVGWKVGRRVVLDNDPIKDTDARVVEVRIQLDAASSRTVAGLSYARIEVYIDAPPWTEGQ